MKFCTERCFFIAKILDLEHLIFGISKRFTPIIKKSKLINAYPPNYASGVFGATPIEC